MRPAVAALLLALLLILGLVLLLAGIATKQRRCAGAAAPVPFAGPGSLGGVAGTGVTQAQLETVRTGSVYRGTRVTPGRYLSTAYGPPWGGIQGAGAFTSGGIALAGGAPRMYMLAVDPLLISHGTLVYAWPNPFHWPGPFLVADTGAAVKGRHIDFYDWRGRRSQLRWRQPNTTVSSQPIKPGGPDVTSIAPVGPCSRPAPVSGPVGRRIATLAIRNLGKRSRIAGFQPPSTASPWCEWFASNIYRQAQVPGWPGTDLYSGTPYTWAQARGQLFKAAGRPPRGPTPPLGAAVMYGPGPNASQHVNLVTRIYADGSFELIGGNQTCPGGPNCVSRRGPCRLTQTAHAHLTGPACGDSREVYGIAAPTA
jgi:3D (Asp-Asp-Asp) domain-containing protein